MIIRELPVGDGTRFIAMLWGMQDIKFYDEISKEFKMLEEEYNKRWT